MKGGKELESIVNCLKKLDTSMGIIVQIVDGDFYLKDPDELHQLHTWWTVIYREREELESNKDE